MLPHENVWTNKIEKSSKQIRRRLIHDPFDLQSTHSPNISKRKRSVNYTNRKKVKLSHKEPSKTMVCEICQNEFPKKKYDWACNKTFSQ